MLLGVQVVLLELGDHTHPLLLLGRPIYLLHRATVNRLQHLVLLFINALLAVADLEGLVALVLDNLVGASVLDGVRVTLGSLEVLSAFKYLLLELEPVLAN